MKPMNWPRFGFGVLLMVVGAAVMIALSKVVGAVVLLVGLIIAVQLSGGPKVWTS